MDWIFSSITRELALSGAVGADEAQFTDNSAHFVFTPYSALDLLAIVPVQVSKNTSSLHMAGIKLDTTYQHA
jgi:hypothetical protein